jgi:hypothetical protein
MSAEEKQAVLRDWERFLRNMVNGGGQGSERLFTKRLYAHLHLHCSFIAHFNRMEFFGTYFDNPEDTLRFFTQFDSEHGCRSVELGGDWWLRGDYEDLNSAMCQSFEAVKAELIPKLKEKVRKNDVAKAAVLLAKHGLTIAQQVSTDNS